MVNFQIERESLKVIETHQLSAVIFIMDYLQLQFDGDELTILTNPSIFDGQVSLKWMDPGFRDKLCGFITKIVKRTDIYEYEIYIEFEDYSTIIIPLTGPTRGEAVIFRHGHGKNGGWWVLHKFGPGKDNE